jgi:hypothetical protein
LSAWIGSQLTGAEPVITAAVAQGTGLWSPVEGAYSRLICQIIDADRDLRNFLPKVAIASETEVGDTALIGEWNGITVVSS